jgi:hypothetical protein
MIVSKVTDVNKNMLLSCLLNIAMFSRDEIFFSFLTDFSYLFSSETKILKVAGYSQNR